MNDQKKPVDVGQIIEALRCMESDGLAGFCYCETCPFAEKVKLSNSAFTKRCNFDGILQAAADRLANARRHITALQKEIEKLRSGRRWIPVTERLPENEKDVLIAFTRKGLRGGIYRCVGMAFHTDGKTNTEDSAYSWELGNVDMEYDEGADAYIIPEGWWETVNFGENFTAVDMPVTHWCPLPEAPEVE